MVRFIMKSIEKWLKDKPKGMSLFLEEAQNYVEKGDDMRDLLTRMRHIGFFPTFITNDPTTLPSEVLSLADNIISFKFDSDMDRNHLARSGKIDDDIIPGRPVPPLSIAFFYICKTFPYYQCFQ